MATAKFNWEQTCKMLTRDKLSEKCYVEMGKKLSDPVGSGVEMLGSELNLSQSDMQTISRCENPGRHLLKLWSRGPDTMVYVLYRALERINRYDVISVLKRELSDCFELIISVQDANSDAGSAPKLFHPLAEGEQVMRDVISGIPELTDTPHEDIHCVMESQPENFFETKASKFRGNLIQLLIHKSQMRMRSNTAPTTGNPITRPTRDVMTMPPIQETGEDDYQKLVQRSGTITQARRGSETKNERIDFSLDTACKTIKRTSADSGRESVHSCSRLSTDSNDSDLDVNFIDPASRLDRNSQGDPKNYWTWKANSEPTENKDQLRISSLISGINLNNDTKMSQSSDPNSDSDDVGDYITVPGQLEAVGLKDLPGYHPGIISTIDIENKLKGDIEEDGVYFVRKSRESAHLYCISIVYNREIVNYRIHQDVGLINGHEQFGYYIYENAPIFSSIPECLQYYSKHSMNKPGENGGPVLGRAV